MNSREWEDDDYSYDRARRAVSRGDILPIEEILEQVHNQISGKILEIELEDGYQGWVYEIKFITARGQRLEAYFDARTGKLISVEDD